MTGKEVAGIRENDFEKNRQIWIKFARTACMVCLGLTVMASAALADESEPAEQTSEDSSFVDVVKNVSSTIDGIKTMVLENEKKDIFQKDDGPRDLGSLVTDLAESATAVTVKNAVSGAEEQAYESVRETRSFLSSNSDVNGAVKEAASGPRSAIDSAYDFAEEQVSNNRPTVADTQGKDIRVYTSIGDSVQSGCGLEEYATYGQIVVANENIRGSAPVLVGRAIGADKVNQLHMPGARSTEIRYILDDEYDGDWITDGQSYYLSDGVLGKEHLDSWKEEYQNAVRESDVVVLDFGFNDFWVPWYGAMYDVAGDGRLPWDDMTPWERVERMGSFGALADTLASVGRAYIFNPTNWWIYDLKFADSILKFAVDYPVNCFAITDSIYDLNPDATLLICIGYNPMEGWDLVPAWDDNLVGDVLGVVFAAHDIAKIAAFLSYPGEAALVDMRHVDVITDNTMIFVFEKMTIDDSGFNPHPTVRGSEQVASQILKALGRGTPYATID